MTPDELRARRLAIRYSQRQLAGLLDTAVANLQNWEQGRVPIPGFLHLALYCIEHCPPPGYELLPEILRRGGVGGRRRKANPETHAR
jgi:transcriptional regulator with XRE-family HTH domain